MRRMYSILRFSPLASLALLSACASVPTPTARVVFPVLEEKGEGAVDLFVLRAGEDGEGTPEELVRVRADAVSRRVKEAVESLGRAMNNRCVPPERFIVYRAKGDEAVEVCVAWADWFPGAKAEVGADVAPARELTILALTEADVDGLREMGWTPAHLASWYVALLRDYYRLFSLNRRPVYTAGIPEAAVLSLIYETSYAESWKEVSPESLNRAIGLLDGPNRDAFAHLPGVIPQNWGGLGTARIAETGDHARGEAGATLP